MIQNDGCGTAKSNIIKIVIYMHTKSKSLTAYNFCFEYDMMTPHFLSSSCRLEIRIWKLKNSEIWYFKGHHEEYVYTSASLNERKEALEERLEQRERELIEIQEHIDRYLH